jgi:phosphotransferase system enzyme I (PtsI)
MAVSVPPSSLSRDTQARKAIDAFSSTVPLPASRCTDYASSMSFTVHGIGVSGGIAMGYAHLVSHARLEVAHYVVPKSRLQDEVARFEGAIAQAREELSILRRHIPPNAPPEFDAFINVHQMILEDATLSEEPRRLIETQQCNAEWALKLKAEELISQFLKMEDAYLRERKDDVLHVVERVMKALLGQPGYGPATLGGGEQSSILVAHDLSPADMLIFKQHQFGGFITDVGGATSHTAIIARSLGIPCVAALHHARALIHEAEHLVVDGTQGVVIVNPDKQILSEYRLRQNQWELERLKLKRLRTTFSTTLDGTPIELHANIEVPDDVEEVKENGAMGIGLFRSEFLFMNRPALPDEDEQFEAYRRVAREMRGLPVTIRTLDLGADKRLDGDIRITNNPAMGLRAIRWCLAEPNMFQIQLRAILRASHYGNVRLLIPMLSGAAELEQTLHLIEQAKKSLDADGIPYDRAIQVGGMIEIPAAALALNLFTRKLDFLSIGTNDLIQYTLAIDRADDRVAHLYDPLHPAVLMLLAGIIRTANKAGVPVAVCGEMAGDVKLTRLLLGCGLRIFSMHPANLLAVKQQVLKTDLELCTPIANKMLRSEDPERIRELVERLNA